MSRASIGMKVKTIFSSTIVRYLSIRYLTYFIQFINSLLLLHYLSPDNFGIYSFILLLLSYYSYTNVGLNASLNTLLSVHKRRNLLINKIWSVALGLNIFLILIIGILCIIAYLVYPSLFIKYNYSAIALKVYIIGVTINTNLLFVSLYRVFGKFNKINIQQIIPQLSIFFFILLLRNKLSISNVLFILIISNIAVLMIMINKPPLPLKFIYNKTIARNLLIRGFHLMLYNFSFNFITIAATTIVSIFYLSSELGYYSFSNTLSNAIVMITSSIMFILYPKILNQFANLDEKNSFILINKIRDLYILAVDLIGLSTLFLIPIISLYTTKYSLIIATYKILLAAQLVLNNTSGYLQYLIARKQEKVLIIYALYGIVGVIVLGISIANLKLSFHSISLGVLIGVTIYTYFVINHSNKILQIKSTFVQIMKIIFNLPKMIVILTLLASYIFKENIISPIFALTIYFLIKRKKIVLLIDKSNKILKDNNFVNF